MKLVMTSTEVCNVVRKHYNLPSEIELEILSEEPGGPGISINKSRSTLVIQGIRDIESLHYSSTQKVAAIKRLRELIPGTGLAEAKTIIEHWTVFRNMAIKKGDWPTIKSLESSCGVPVFE